MKRKVILTKKRLKALNLAICLDDVLHAKYQRMHNDFMRTVARYRKKPVSMVVADMGDYMQTLMVERVQEGPDGYIITVRKP